MSILTKPKAADSPMQTAPDPRNSNNLLDMTSIGLSGLCVAHCLLLPLAFAALPVLGQMSGSHLIHQVLILIAAPLSLWTLFRSQGWKKAHVLAMALIGLTLLGSAAFVEALIAYETPLSLVGAALVAGAHYMNTRRHKPRPKAA